MDFLRSIIARSSRGMVRTALLVAVLTISLAACSSASGAEASPAAPAAGAQGNGAASIVARSLSFEPRSLSVPAGTAFTLGFDNQEAAPHNVAIYTDSSASKALFVGEILSSQKTSYQVPALAPGSYFFRCDLHPEMTGSIVAK